MKSTVSFILCVVLLVTVCLPAELIALADQDVPNDTPTENHTITDGQATNGEIYYFDYIKDFQASKVDDLVLFEGEKRHTKETDLMFTLNFPENAWYNLTIEYIAERDDNGEIGFGLKIDGKYPFYEARRFTIPRLYKDEGAVRKDGIGNEFTPIQSEEYIKQTVKLANYSSFDTDATKFYFSKGTHSLIFTEFSSAVKFYKISLTEIEETKNYGEILEKNKDNKKCEEYEGNEILLEGENAIYKSESDLIAKADNSSPAVYPSDPFKQRVNFIGSNWSDTGEKITWNINVPKTALYSLSFHYRQSYILNGNSYRSLEIDGKVPFREAESIAFPYGSGWKCKTFSDENDNPFLIYLTEGSHTVSLCVTLGPMASFCNKLQDTVFEIGEWYRQIVMITGENPDNNRDYNLFKQIPGLEEGLESIVDSLEELSESHEKISGKRGGSTVSILNSMKNSIKEMLKYKYKAQRYKSAYYSNYSSISATLYDLMDLPLDIDTIVFSQPNKKIEKGKTSLINKVSYFMQRFLASFVIDYNVISGTSESEDEITLWINWGRDQAQMLNSLIQSDFAPNSNVGVHVKITNASLVQGVLSGNTPDCVLQQARSEPVNLAMRNAAYDLKQFSDYSEVVKRFAEGAVIPYEYNGGVYGLPDTQSFMMMFIRTDIFEEMGLSIPKTWNEFIDVMNILSGNNLQTGLAGNVDTTDTAASATSICFNLFLAQFGGELYNRELNATDLLSPEAISAFEFFTDFFTKYNCPMTYNFYNRFRTGIMPMGIQNYQMYATITATAPEIKNRWTMVPLPNGFSDDDSKEVGISVGTGTACMILKDSNNPEKAWEFLKWWTSDEIQLTYVQSVESVLGVSGRVPTSNLTAASKLLWEGKSFVNLQKQWKKVKEFNEIPGSYYVPRIIDQAYWNVVENNENPKDMLYRWSEVADNEIAKKINQYQ